MSYSPSVNEHRQAAPRVLTFAVLTVSDSRTLDTDRSGQLIVDLLQAAGHTLQVRSIVPDEPERIRGEAERWCREERIDVILLTGGTGISPRDQTPEAIRPLLEVELPGFGELFRWLSYQEIGPAAMLSRALAGRCGETLIFCLPGSTAAVRLACEQLLVPELPHLVHHSRASS
ncbi:MogA/MoaB family molybdenum cofactor biosynthesis protein [Aureliella helgolandensis]|uniref:Molybdenum cofactor biosynthesis protein B n=1 Tax=Aureliella helgolandensis TaxID=2527968 RepID=A0A518FZL9_9BACT|nr:MogA/MoaB family molybdenum cofactor biosynthesis protein [Aureliella helgolandensis]QDV21802.1 Molybdenum cofactor biosynthesis protein B [Aureliella helgolandensis]